MAWKQKEKKIMNPLSKRETYLDEVFNDSKVPVVASTDYAVHTLSRYDHIFPRIIMFWEQMVLVEAILGKD